MTEPAVLGIGTALPEHSISQAEAAEHAIALSCETEEHARKLPKLYRVTAVERRGSVLLTPTDTGENRVPFYAPPKNGNSAGPTITERMHKYEAEAGPLALQASRNALQNSDCAGDSITHLVTVSCSGFCAPGVDLELIKGLDLPSGVQRTHVGFMGCHGALNGIRVARAFAASDPTAKILICAVELCSLHFQYGWRPEQNVANALFADGAAALVIAATENGSSSWHVTATASKVIPNSEDAMTWRVRNHGFEMTLAPSVPILIQEHLKPWLDSWLAEQELAIEDIASWAVHPGGPSILRAVSKALGLPRHTLDLSYDILREHGNMSSPTVLFILEKLRQQDAPTPCLALGFGPGLVAEATLIR